MVALRYSRRPLYRKAALAVICAAGLGVGASAQLPHSHQLRALAVLELYGPAQRPTGGRVVPVAILVGDKWYDAGSYRATPRPLALDPGTVYEALRDGEPAGFFTVAAARQKKGEWFGAGKWESREQLEAAEQARAAAYREKTRTLSEEEAPPRLRKPGSTGPAKQAPEKPVSSEESPAGAKVSPRIEAERAHPVQAEKPLPEHEADPERPTLRRGGGAQVSSTLEAPVEAAPAAGQLAARAGAPRPSAVFIGVSDPDGTGQTRDFGFPWKPEEQRALTARAIALAEAEVQKYLAARPNAPKKPKPVKLATVRVAAYDLMLDNNAELVVSGEAGGAFVTLIARSDLNFVPQKIFASVTDREHRDAIPRMELVGAVDAEGRGKGELLFRLEYDSGFRWALYATNRDQAWPLWQSSLFGE